MVPSEYPKRNAQLEAALSPNNPETKGSLFEACQKISYSGRFSLQLSAIWVPLDIAIW